MCDGEGCVGMVTTDAAATFDVDHRFDICSSECVGKYQKLIPGGCCLLHLLLLFLLFLSIV